MNKVRTPKFVVGDTASIDLMFGQKLEGVVLEVRPTRHQEKGDFWVNIGLADGSSNVDIFMSEDTYYE